MDDPNLNRTLPVTIDAVTDSGAGFGTVDATGAQFVISSRTLDAAGLDVGSRAVCRLRENNTARAAVPYAVQYVDPDATAALHLDESRR